MFENTQKKNYGQFHKMDNMLFANVTKAIFEKTSHNIFTANFNSSTECVILITLWQYAFCKRYTEFEGKYFRFYGIHIAQISTRYVVLILITAMYTPTIDEK